MWYILIFLSTSALCQYWKKCQQTKSQSISKKKSKPTLFIKKVFSIKDYYAHAIFPISEKEMKIKVDNETG